MIVRSAYLLKAFATLDEALAYSRKIQSGAGSHADSELEIEFDSKAKKNANLHSPTAAALAALGQKMDEEEDDTGNQWRVMVVNASPVPGGSTCAECNGTHFEDDYLCTDCRANT